MDLNGVIPSFDSTTLQGLEISGQPDSQGVLPVRSRNRQYVRFYEREEFDASKVRAGVAPSEAKTKRLFIHAVTPGDKTEINTYAEDSHKRMYWREYQSFKEGKTAPLGRPVSDCDFITEPEATELLHMGVHTVEQLADASDTLLEHFPRGFELREFAKAWAELEHQADSKKISKDIEAVVASNAALATQLQDAQKENAELRGMVQKILETQSEMKAEKTRKKQED